jgi:hypothetical protein
MSTSDDDRVETGLEAAAAYLANRSNDDCSHASQCAFENDRVETGIEEAAPHLIAPAKDDRAHIAQWPETNGDSVVPRRDALEAAESYIRAGWKTFPGKRGNYDHRDKEPVGGWSWKNHHLTLVDAPTYFGKDEHNVLVVLGHDSGNLTDIDLDWPEACAAADVIFSDLPPFGRSGKPRSHRLARCDVKTQKFLLPQSLATHPQIAGQQAHTMCIAEIRGSGAYTVFPGSEHQTGERIEWTDASVDNVGSIPDIEPDVLRKRMGLLAFAAFCTRFFPAIGTRCDFMMAVAGALARAGYGADAIQKTVQAIGSFNNDEGDNGSWRVASESVAGKLDDGKEVTGLPTLIKILGLDEDVLKWCREMLGTPVEDTTEGKWPDGQLKNGKPKRGILNTIEAIKRLGIHCAWDEFRQKERWHGHEDRSFDGDVSDAAVVVTRRNIQRQFGFYPGSAQTSEAITCACRDNKFDPVLDHYAKLNWDGQPRLEKMLHRYLGAPDTSLNSAIGVKFICAVVRRAKQPGCKFDQQLVVQGPQGAMKSTFCEDLAIFPDLYTDTGDLSGSIKDQMEIIQGKQIIEFPELAGYNRASREHNKAMLSRKVDRSRLSYARYATDAPRRSVPIATTNEDNFLSDPTGERRTWHFAMTSYDREAFLRDKDQLYAEAVAREPSEKLWLDTPELKAEHDAMVATAKAPDDLVDQLSDLIGEVWDINGQKEERVSVTDIKMKLGLSMVDSIRLHSFGRRVADAMKTLGWRKAPKNIRCHKGGSPTAGYSRPWIEQNTPDGGDEANAPPLQPTANTAEDVGQPEETDTALDERVAALSKSLSK